MDAYVNAKAIADKYGWVQVACTENGRIKSIDEIHELIYNKVKEIL